MSESLTQAINDMRNMRESYDQLSAAADAYNTGKEELAQNISSKGVQASADETLPELAEKVLAITQDTYILEGGEMYAKQLFGNLTTPNYWNLYEVLEMLLSDGRLVNYSGILLAEYYKGYDSLALAGAGAGGAYVVSDIENGQFKMYTEDTTHVWNTNWDGKVNRWVAYCFDGDYHDFQITDTNTSPRTIFIGRKVGIITSLVSGRTSQIVVPDGNELMDFRTELVQQWDKKIVIRNIKNHSSGWLLGGLSNTGVESVYLQIDQISGGGLISYGGGSNSGATQIKSLVIDCNSATGGVIFPYGRTLDNLAVLVLRNISGTLELSGYNNQDDYLSSLRNLCLVDVEDFTLQHLQYGGIFTLTDKAIIYIGYKTNDKTKTISLSGGPYKKLGFQKVQDLQLKDGWCKPLLIGELTGLTKENVQAHIFDRLGVNDLSTGAVTITLANAVLNLFTQEEIDAVVARTNITIVGA